MTLEEATEAGLLADALKALRKERAGALKMANSTIAFDDNMYVPRSVFLAMAEYGLLYTRNRLAELGVTVPDEAAK